MRSLVSIVVAVAVILHMVLGSCWHHAHEPVAKLALAQTETPPPVKACRCQHHQSREHEKQLDQCPSDKEPVDKCPGSCGEKCVYLSANRVQVDQSLDLALFNSLPLEPLSVLVAGPSIARYESDDATVDPPPLRLHLLHQLLLI